MDTNDGRHYLVGRVYPRDHCYGNGPNAESTKDITDNIPQSVMEKLNLTGIPLTSGHPPVNKVVRDAPEIIRGRVQKSFVNHDGDLWAVSELDTSSDRGRRLLDNVTSGKEMGLSLGHVFNAKTMLGKITSSEHVPDHLGIVDSPRRPNCFVYHFLAKKDIPKSFTPEHIANLTRAISRLPSTRRTIVNANSTSGDPIEITSHDTCSLGVVVNPNTLEFVQSVPGSIIADTIRGWGNDKKDTGILGQFYGKSEKKERTSYKSGGIDSLQGIIESKSLHSNIPRSSAMSSQSTTGQAAGTATTPSQVQNIVPGGSSASNPAQKNGKVVEENRDNGNTGTKDVDMTQSQTTGAPTTTNGPPGVITPESLKDEVASMDEARRLDVMAAIINKANKTQHEFEQLKANMQAQKQQEEETETAQLTNQISSFLEGITRDAQAVSKAEGRTDDVSGDDLQQKYQDLMKFLPIDKRRDLSALVQSSVSMTQVASRKAGDLQQQANSNKRRRLLPGASGNESVFASFNYNQEQSDRGGCIDDFLNTPINFSEQLQSVSPSQGYSNGGASRPANLATVFGNSGGRPAIQEQSPQPFESFYQQMRTDRPLSETTIKGDFDRLQREIDMVNRESNGAYTRQTESKIKFKFLE